ncbi:hypothetical protein K439DRAFT_1641815 [Ramaria rubella]|nr:hypothetical protein K439DRAFT_1641815 [Ramaria rubella]
MLRIPENVFHLPVLLPPHSTYNLKSFSPQKQKPRLVVAPPLASFLPLPSTSPSFNMSPSSWSPLDDLYTQPGDSEREQKWERHHPFPFFPPSRSRLHDITPDIDLPAVLQGYPESALRSSLTMLV